MDSRKYTPRPPQTGGGRRLEEEDEMLPRYDQGSRIEQGEKRPVSKQQGTGGLGREEESKGPGVSGPQRKQGGHRPTRRGGEDKCSKGK